MSIKKKRKIDFKFLFLAIVVACFMRFAALTENKKQGADSKVKKGLIQWKLSQHYSVYCF